MAELEVLPFGDEHLDAAGALLAERHARHRAAQPLLPEVDAREAVADSWREPGTTGVLALRDGQPVGYLFAALEGELAFWGNFAWVDRAGHASRDPELVRDLYAAAAEAWFVAGADRHYVLVPATPEALDPWYRLGFAHMHVEAIRESGCDPRPLPDGVSIRRGGPEDLDDAIRVHDLIPDVQERSPSFSLDAAQRDQRERWIETLADPHAMHLVAELEGRVVGQATLHQRLEFATPADAAYLASIATIPDVRGRGVGLALTERALAWAADAGYASVVVNWRMTNLFASRFFPARGFRPIFHRLHRAIGLG